MFLNFMPRDWIAGITIVGGFILILSGANGTVGSMLLAVTMFYFGVESLEKRKRGGEYLDFLEKVARRK